MTLLSLTDCSHLLAVDAKTLRRWLSLAHLSAQPHPLDGRLKCLTREQLQQLAASHHRTLETQAVIPETASLCIPTSGMSTTLSSSLNADVRVAPVSRLLLILGRLLRSLLRCCIIPHAAPAPDCSVPRTSLTKQLASLQTQVATLQHQLTLLTDHLQKELQNRTCESSTLQDKSLVSSQNQPLEASQEKSLPSSQDKSLVSSQDQSGRSPQEKSLPSSQDQPLVTSQEKESTRAVANVSIDRGKHAHVLPLVEYAASGKYLVISPQQGLLECLPDSAEWFAWLSTLSSFRFVGPSGHLTVHRDPRCNPRWSWRATRSIRSRSHSLHLVRTELLTIAVLEQAAASLQSLLN
jgi:hypothetical protein